MMRHRDLSRYIKKPAPFGPGAGPFGYNNCYNKLLQHSLDETRTRYTSRVAYREIRKLIPAIAGE
jgi:hypothetical protein